MPLKPPASDWLSAFEAHLAPLPPGERTEVVAEIRAHLLETGEEPAATFGDAGGYAERFLVAQDLTAGSWSALLALMRLGRVALLGPILLLEAFGVALLVVAVLDLVMPDNTGLFLEDGGFSGFGAFIDPQGTEILGRWVVPLAGLPGAFCVWAGFRWSRAIATRLAGELRRRG